MIDGYASITTARKGSSKPIDIYRLQDFNVDASMDTDTDQWTLTIGDPKAELIDTLRRDAEVRVSLYARDRKKFQVLQTGFADEVGFDTDGNLAINGRDMTSVAVDSQAPPNQWRNARPSEIIEKEARELGIGSRVELPKTAPFKTLARDGSETYWEFWYRLMRKRSMWLWSEPDGILTGGFLDYNAKPSYKFGRPSGSFTSNNPGWIAVEHAMWKKSTANRIGEVFVIGSNTKGSNFFAHEIDSTIKHWIKRPIKILSDSSARTQNETNASAKEEIFESIVGAIEWQLVIQNSDQLIRQNTTCEVNIPEMGLKGTFFVVGCKTFLSVGEGLYQVVRLRERNFALTKRIPDDPLLGQNIGVDEFGASNAKASLPVRWSNCFVYAANNHHGPWGMKEFLAVLLSMCEAETGFRNVRVGGGPEHPYTTGDPIPSIVTDPAGAQRFQQQFENENPTRAVGPMQLYTQSYKLDADRLYDPATVGDQYIGGRWWPCSNIQAAAKALRAKAAGQEVGSPPLPIEQIWPAVRAYNGAGPVAEKYMNDVKASYPGYLSMVNSSMTTADTPSDADYTPVAEGPRADLARRILDYMAKGLYKDGNDTKTELQLTAQGKRVPSKCGGEVFLDDMPLKSILLLLDNGYKVGAWVFCSTHDCHVDCGNPPCSVSRHAVGFAVDISHIGKGATGHLSLGTGGLTCATLTIQAMDLIRLTLNPSQIICDGVGNDHIDEVAAHQWNRGKLQPSWVVGGHTNHIHVGF
jgi:prophage tail gpP-like protein